MVLEEASSSSSSSPGSGFTTDQDPDNGFEQPSNARSGVAVTLPNGMRWMPWPEWINLKEYPRPIPFFNTIFGSDDQTLKKVIMQQAASRAQVLGRDLRPEEWEAMTYHIAKMFATSSFGSPIGILAGLWRAENTKKEFKFPFFRPDLQKTDFTKFRLLNLEGPRATAFWHLLRRGAYLLAAVPLARGLVSSYALAVGFTGTIYDPRMKEYRTIVEGRARDGQDRFGRSNTPRAPKQPSLGSPSNDSLDQHSQQPEEQWSYGGASSSQSPSSSPYYYDDASPTAGAEPIQPVSQQAQSQETAWQRIRRDNAPMPRSQQQGQSPNPPITGGDAWARIRGGSQNGSQQDQPQQQGGESFSFSSQDEDRQLARDDAQRDFDARIERKRTGQDFDGQSRGSGEGSGWRRG